MDCKQFPLPRYCLHNVDIYYRAIRYKFPADKIRVFNDTVEMHCDSEHEYLNLKNQVQKVIHRANADHVSKLLDLKMKYGDEYAQLLDSKRCTELLEAKKVSNISEKSNTKIIIDRNGGVNIFGSTEDILKARSLLNDFFKMSMFREDVPPLSQYQKLQKQNGQKGNSPVYNWSNENFGKSEIPNDPANLTFTSSFRNSHDPSYKSCVRFMIKQYESGPIIGTKGNKRREFQNNFNVSVFIFTEDVNTSNEVAVEIWGKTDESVHKAKEAILQYLKKFEYDHSMSKTQSGKTPFN